MLTRSHALMTFAILWAIFYNAGFVLAIESRWNLAYVCFIIGLNFFILLVAVAMIDYLLEKLKND